MTDDEQIGGQIVAEFEYDGEAYDLTHRYLHGPGVDQILADEYIDGTTHDVYWALTDHQGSVRDVIELAGATATVANHIQYDSFGNITAESDGTVDFRFTYTGRELDEATDLYYYRARYYDANTGRFISEDPIAFESNDTNLYRYVTNNPLTKTDPSGLDPAKWTQSSNWSGTNYSSNSSYSSWSSPSSYIDFSSDIDLSNLQLDPAFSSDYNDYDLQIKDHGYDEDWYKMPSKADLSAAGRRFEIELQKARTPDSWIDRNVQRVVNSAVAGQWLSQGASNEVSRQARGILRGTYEEFDAQTHVKFNQATWGLSDKAGLTVASQYYQSKIHHCEGWMGVAEDVILDTSKASGTLAVAVAFSPYVMKAGGAAVMNEIRTGLPASRKAVTQVSYFGRGFLGNPVVSGNTSRMQAMRQIGQLQRLCENGQANKATKIMVEMSKTTQGREQLLNIHRMASKMIPYAQTSKAASTWTGIQQVSGALQNGAN